MSSTDGINSVPRLPSEGRTPSVPRQDAAKLSKTAEDYVRIENQLAAQREKPSASPQFTSIFDQLRDHLSR